MLRTWAIALVLTSLVFVPSCVAESAGGALALRDPYGLIDDVTGAGNALRLYVLPAEAYSCNGDGTVTPDMASDDFVDAIVDISLTADTAMDTARGEARVPVGNWTVLVRGRGTDPVSMVPNQIIATGCTTVDMLGNGETREVTMTLQPVTGSGICGDPILSPDEQCEPPGTAVCDAMCQTIAQPLNNGTTTGAQLAPRFAARLGQRVIAVMDSRPDALLRMLDANGANLTSPGALERDRSIDLILTDGGGTALTGEQLGGVPAIAPDGRIAIPLVDFAMPADTDVRVVFLSQDRTVMGVPANARMTRTMPQRRPSAAFTGTGTLLVAFEDLASSTGLSATFFAAGSTTPSAEAVAVGSTGGTEPALVAHDTGFVLAFTAGGDVFFQRFAADGSATDATPRPVLESAGGTQDQPAVAALSNGVFAVAWREGDLTAGDGAGSAIRARIFAADGTASTAAFLVNSTTAGDQVTPAVAAADGRFLFAWQSGAEVRARMFGQNGLALLNRERLPAAVDFAVAAGNASAPTLCAVGSGDGASWLVGWTAPTDGSGDAAYRRYPR